MGEERILEYAWRLKKNGYRESAIVSRVKILRGLARQANLSNLEATKAAIADLNVSEGRKENLVCVYGMSPLVLAVTAPLRRHPTPLSAPH